ncbi:response regulator [Amaricoccus tamworthensis]|uniref:response regulator n=1 Tax=Amaricoccus tamworthensis TaxID=57002 RepID=UPI003C7D9883
MTFVGLNRQDNEQLPRLVSRDARNAAMLVHDIRGALRGISGSVSELEGMELADAAQDQVRRLATASATLERLVEFAAGNGSSDENAETTNFPEALSRLERRMAGEAASKGLKFGLVEEGMLPCRVRMDSIGFNRIVDNLVLNAIHHSGGGEVQVRVTRSGDGGVTVAVLDAGPGVPERVIQDLRNLALSSQGAPEAEHGLGLQIVQGLTEKYGCEFSLDNRAEGGAVATFGIPADLCIDEKAAAPASPVASVAYDFSGVRILLAEDNPTNQMVATQMLGAMNAGVTVVSDGVEALEEFEKSEYDLVVADIEMPRLSGLDVIRTIRARGDARAKTPIVALTAYAMREHRDRINEAGANGLISKPITSINDLGRSLSEFVSAAGSRTSAAGTAVNGGQSGVDTEGEPVIDLGTFAELRDTIGTEMLAELLEKVITDLETSKTELEMSVNPLDRLQIRSSSHILISVGGAIGANRLQYCARTLNTAAHDGTAEGLDDLVRECVREIDAAMEFVLEQQQANGPG